MKKIAVIGTPNVGKSTFFNHLTGGNQITGNWSGVTVDLHEGLWKTPMGDVLLVDLPGLHSILPNPHSTEDEAVSRKFILQGDYDLVINLVNADRLERSLFLTAQLRSLGVPMIVVVNMLDVARTHQLHIRIDKLQEALGCPVVGIEAQNTQLGYGDFYQRLQELLTPQSLLQPKLPLTKDLAEAVLAIRQETNLPQWQILHHLYHNTLSDPRWYPRLNEYRQMLLERTGDDPALLVAGIYFQIAHQVAHQTLDRKAELSIDQTDRIDAWILHPWLGLPIFALAMLFVFSFSIHIGGAFIDAMDILAGAIFIDGTRALLQSLSSPTWLEILLADGLGAGIQLVATFIPVIGGLFIAMALLESTGYMARAAYITNALMNRLGLSGKAFVPLIVGFGCNVPAVTATRTLERRRDRIITMLMVPFMSCSARLATFAVFATAFFPQWGGLMIFSLYLLGILVAILTALVLKITLLPGKPAPFIIELPVYQKPRMKMIWRMSWARIRDFVLGAGKVIIMVTLVIQFLNGWNTDGSFGRGQEQNSMLSEVAKSITPALAPLGIEESNWPASVGLITGILAKEVVIGSLDALYTPTDETSEPPEVEIAASLQDALAVTWQNLTGLGSTLLDPLGLGIISDQITAETAESQGLQLATYQHIRQAFTSDLSVYAYLVLILLYFPCVATMGAIQKEAGRRWMWISIVWSVTLAYALATLIYQLGTWQEHPLQSFLWLAFWLSFFAAVLGFARSAGLKQVQGENAH